MRFTIYQESRPGKRRDNQDRIAQQVQHRESSEFKKDKLKVLAELTKLPDESVTQALLDLATDTRTAPELLELARAAIAKRTNGIEPMLAALDKRYDYLAGTLVAPRVVLTAAHCLPIDGPLPGFTLEPDARGGVQHPAAGAARWARGDRGHEVLSLVDRPAEPAGLGQEPALQRQGR